MVKSCKSQIWGGYSDILKRDLDAQRVKFETLGMNLAVGEMHLTFRHSL